MARMLSAWWSFLDHDPRGISTRVSGLKMLNGKYPRVMVIISKIPSSQSEQGIISVIRKITTRLKRTKKASNQNDRSVRFVIGICRSGNPSNQSFHVQKVEITKPGQSGTPDQPCKNPDIW